MKWLNIPIDSPAWSLLRYSFMLGYVVALIVWVENPWLSGVGALVGLSVIQVTYWVLTNQDLYWLYVDYLDNLIRAKSKSIKEGKK